MFALYIPIWLYSDVGGYRSGEYNEYFTFQSGYIPTVELLHARTLVHLALHSNLVIFQRSPPGNKIFARSFFTFQSGYIPTFLKAPALLPENILYIPIWLYSNSHSLTSLNMKIPSLHSNLVIFQRDEIEQLEIEVYFTFQSGYIPTSLLASSDIALNALHSNLVIFQLLSLSIGKIG